MVMRQLCKPKQQKTNKRLGDGFKNILLDREPLKLTSEPIWSDKMGQLIFSRNNFDECVSIRVIHVTFLFQKSLLECIWPIVNQ